MINARLLVSVLLAGVSLATIGCSKQDRDNIYDKSTKFATQDRELDYDRDDYRNAMRPRPVKKGDSLDNIPELMPIIAEDKKNILPQPLVSITVNQDVPIRDIFYELAKQAEVDLELDPTITGSIIFTAYNRPFDQVVERICDMSGLRYQFKNNVIRIERDTPYMETYKIGYLGIKRDFTSSINSSTSSASGSSGGGGSNGSTSSITSTTNTDFWVELEANITQIIQATNQQVSLTDQSAPISAPQAIPALSTDQLASVSPPAAAGATALPAIPADTSAAAGTATTPAASPAAAAAPTAPVAASPAPVPAQGSSSPAVAGLLNPTATQNAVAGGAAGGTAGAAAGGASSAGSVANPYFSINRQAGMVNVFASGKQHRRIRAYIDEMMKSVNTQVLIEAKVFEVELNDENTLGIDWSYINDDTALGISLDRLGFTDPTTTTGGVFALSSGRFDAVLTAISRFGTVRALSSPRLSVMNNQTAVLNVSESRVFFKLEIERTEGTDNNPPRTDITSETNNVPEGLIITVHPSVDNDTGEITMNLRPSMTRIVRSVSDPGTAIAARLAGLELESFVPELSVREIDSIVKMDSGRTIIMGGLMQDRAEGTQQSIPLLGELPLVGNLFRAQRDLNKKTEMVIMLKATIVGNNPKLDQTDKDLYNSMGQDRHPFEL